MTKCIIHHDVRMRSIALSFYCGMCAPQGTQCEVQRMVHTRSMSIAKWRRSKRMHHHVHPVESPPRRRIQRKVHGNRGHKTRWRVHQRIQHGTRCPEDGQMELSIVSRSTSGGGCDFMTSSISASHESCMRISGGCICAHHTLCFVTPLERNSGALSRLLGASVRSRTCTTNHVISQ